MDSKRLDKLPERTTKAHVKDIVEIEGVEAEVKGVILDPYENRWKIRTDRGTFYEEKVILIHSPEDKI